MPQCASDALQPFSQETKKKKKKKITLGRSGKRGCGPTFSGNRASRPLRKKPAVIFHYPATLLVYVARIVCGGWSITGEARALLRLPLLGYALGMPAARQAPGKHLCSREEIGVVFSCQRQGTNAAFLKAAQQNWGFQIARASQILGYNNMLEVDLL